MPARAFAGTLCVSALLLAFSAVVTHGQTAAAPMTNEDVVKMAGMGFGDDVIQAKIEQAPNVAFKLDVDDLSKLKAAGVSQPVISTMLKRSTSGGAGAAPGGMHSVVGVGGGPMMSDIGAVKLITKDGGQVDLRSIGGTMSSTYAFVTVLMHANFPGVKADTRIQDHRPTLLIRSANSPKGRLYLVSVDVDKGSGVRSVKIGNSRFGGMKNMGAPDSDNQIDYTAVAEGTDSWRLTPAKDLASGEYGLWSSMREMYDFGID
jgi:hypothetical protein